MNTADGLADALRGGLSKLPLPEASPGQVDDLVAYLFLLERWNRTYNLTSVKEPESMVTRHLLDSLAVAPWIRGSLLDAGSGAGLPGIPLAILLPETAITLLDSSGKKVRFLNHVRRELGLRNVTPVQHRLESFCPARHLDDVISRAFADLASFARAARRLAAPPTRLLAMKGRYPSEELRALPGWVCVQSVEKLSVPGLQENRHLVIMSVIE